MAPFHFILILNRSLLAETGTNTHLQALHASGHQVSNESLQRLGQSLASKNNNGSVLQSLAIGGLEMGDEGILAFLQGIGDASLTVKSMDWSYKSL